MPLFAIIVCMNKIDFSKKKAANLPPDRKRLFVDRKSGAKERVEIVKWAANNGYDALVFPLGEKLTEKTEYIKLAKRYELIIEAGGCDLSLLLPKRLFLFHRELFRMEQGKRKPAPHFCATNPETISIIFENAQNLFARYLPVVTAPRIYHLLPDKGKENIWCACPACRAFSHVEQYIIAVNSAADALAEIDPDAWLSFMDFGSRDIVQSHCVGVMPRGNMFGIQNPAQPNKDVHTIVFSS